MIRAALAAALLSGCAAYSPNACAPMLEAKLLFGAPADPAAFTEFLDRAVTPRFPAGLTVLDAAGRWRDPTGRLTEEHSKLVLILTPQDPGTLPRLNAIRADYQTQFHQQSVGLALTPTCATFSSPSPPGRGPG